MVYLKVEMPLSADAEADSAADHESLDIASMDVDQEAPDGKEGDWYDDADDDAGKVTKTKRDLSTAGCRHHYRP